MPHPFGQRIVEVVRLAHVKGPCSSWTIAKHLPHVQPSNVDKYCHRAVAMGLMTVDLFNKPKLFAAQPGWEAVVQARLDGFIAPPAPPQIAGNPLWSVWGSLPGQKST